MSGRIVAVAATFVAVACAHTRAAPPTPNYVLRDTTAWSNLLYGGSMALLVQGGVVLDTVDLLMGIQTVPGGIVYQPVRKAPNDHEECRPEGACFDLRPWVLRNGTRTRQLADFVPALHAFFSSPSVIDSVLFYWGITPADSGRFRISAMRYDFATRRADSTYLFSEGLETDNPGHLEAPHREGNAIVFGTMGRRFVLSRELRLLRER